MSACNKKCKEEKKVKTLAEYFPAPPEPMTVEKLKSYPSLENISDEKAQELINEMEDICEFLIKACMGDEF